MTADRDALRAALAEALPDVHKPDWHPGMLWTDVYEQWADRILAHPAVLAALGGPGDRNDPAVGLREDIDLLAHAILGGTGFLPHREAAERVLSWLAATPTASPTAGGCPCGIHKP